MCVFPSVISHPVTPRYRARISVISRGDLAAYCSHKLASVPTGQMASSKCSALCSRVFSSMNGDFSRSSRVFESENRPQVPFLVWRLFPSSQCVGPRPLKRSRVNLDALETGQELDLCLTIPKQLENPMVPHLSELSMRTRPKQRWRLKGSPTMWVPEHC